jgi:hypothetical protein
MRHRRLTALMLGLLLLPLPVIGGGQGCAMGGMASAGAEAHGAHHAHAAGGVFEHEPETPAPVGLPHVPAQCVSVVTCAVAAVVAATIIIESPRQLAARGTADAILAPESPAIGLEPAPPRA